MGDVAMTVPVIKALTEQNPSVRITLVTRPFFASFYENLNRVTVYRVDLNENYRGIIGLIKLYKDLSKLNLDAIADLHDVLRTKFIIKLFRISGYKCYQIDKGRKEKNKLTTPRKSKKLIPLISTHERYANVFRKLGYPIDLSIKYKATQKEIPRFITKKIKDQKLIGIAPLAAFKSKSLPENKLKELIEGLNALEGVSIILFGGGNEQKQILESVAAPYKNVLSLVEKINFKEELDLISNLDVMISVDSGNGHMAAMYNIPVITIWGVTHPFLGFTPFNQPMENQILPDLKKFPLIPTSVYGNSVPEGYLHCFDTLKINDIISATKKYI